MPFLMRSKAERRVRSYFYGFYPLARTHGNTWVLLPVGFNEKRTPAMGCPCFVVEATGVAPLADAPRWTVINCPVCQRETVSEESKANNFLPKIPPTLEPRRGAFVSAKQG